MKGSAHHRIFSASLQFCGVAAMLCFAAAASAESYFVDPAAGSDSASGSKDQPFKTIAQAIQKTDGVGGEIHLRPDAGPYHEQVTIRKGGSPDQPLILDGHGAVINLGVDITAGPWEKIDDGCIMTGKLPRKADVANYQTTPIFINGVGIFTDHLKGPAYAPRAKHGGRTYLDAQGRLGIVFPKGLTPENSVIVFAGMHEPQECGVQMSSASNVVVRNLTVAFASNDGFNFHGKGKNIIVENCKALFCADEGFSSHETYEVDTRDCEIAFCGSQSGGVTDVQETLTNYKNIRIHQNRGAFGFQGGKHMLEGIISFGNGGRNLPRPTPDVELRNCQDLGPVAGDADAPLPCDPHMVPESGRQVEETNRIGRYLQLRPAAY